MASFLVKNFGCRATQADGAAIERELLLRGLAPAAGAEQDADVVIFNTCTVTAAADQDARAAIRRLHREKPGCRIVVTGCYAQRAPQEVAALPGVMAVLGNSHKAQVAEVACATALPVETDASPGNEISNYALLDAAFTGLKPGASTSRAAPLVLIGDIFAHTELTGAPVFEAGVRTRPNLKVQDGCGNRCTFCIIPSVRGRSRSLPPQEVLREVQALVDAGYRELVISGINLGRWGRDLPGRQRFEDLVCAILADTALERLRISSVEPMDWSDRLIELMAISPRIAPHAHIPMQSGSDHILRLMHRRYRPWHYAGRVRRIRAAMPSAAIGADVMVGFPGESDADFEQTRGMIEDLPFTYLHVFTYSPRPGTPSAGLPSRVPPEVMKQRNRILRELSQQKKLEFMRCFLGRSLSAITLNLCDAGFTEALTGNYLKLRLPGRHAPNQWVTARVEGVDSEGMTGAVL